MPDTSKNSTKKPNPSTYKQVIENMDKIEEILAGGGGTGGTQFIQSETEPVGQAEGGYWAQPIDTND